MFRDNWLCGIGVGNQNFREEQLPRVLSYADFLKWLSKNKIKDSQMVVKREVITIKK